MQINTIYIKIYIKCNSIDFPTGAHNLSGLNKRHHFIFNNLNMVFIFPLISKCNNTIFKSSLKLVKN